MPPLHPHHFPSCLGWDGEPLQIPLSPKTGTVVFLGEEQGQGALCGGAPLSARPCARRLAFMRYLTSSSPHLSASWETALGPK